MAKAKLKFTIKDLDHNRVVMVPVAERKKPTAKQKKEGVKMPLIGGCAVLWDDQPAGRIQLGFDSKKHQGLSVGQEVTVTFDF